MKYTRDDSWGQVSYDTGKHEFLCATRLPHDNCPYVSDPIVLNVDLTFRCNMDCTYCVAKDTARVLGNVDELDLNISSTLLSQINSSRFLLIVITGGEPLLPAVEVLLNRFLSGLRKKAVIIDTNGTLLPSDRTIRLLLKKHAMVRVSWDSPTPKSEFYFRKYGSIFRSDLDYMRRKELVIKSLTDAGLLVAVQSVVHGMNYSDPNFHRMPFKLRELGITKWYLQRIIPSNRVLFDSPKKKLLITFSEYQDCIRRLQRYTEECGVRCITKLDRRHNSVFLLVRDGVIYTQSDTQPGKKIPLGHIEDIENYFEFVSSADHSSRYYSDFTDT